MLLPAEPLTSPSLTLYVQFASDKCYAQVGHLLAHIPTGIWRLASSSCLSSEVAFAFQCLSLAGFPSNPFISVVLGSYTMSLVTVNAEKGVGQGAHCSSQRIQILLVPVFTAACGLPVTVTLSKTNFLFGFVTVWVCNLGWPLAHISPLPLSLPWKR